MTGEQKELEKILMEFVKRESEEPSSDETIKILPEMVHDLIVLWTMVDQ